MGKAPHKAEITRALLNVYCPEAVATLENPPVAMSIEEIAGALAPAATARAAAPSGPGFDALSAAAQSLMDMDLPTTDLGESWTVRDVLRTLTAYPSNDGQVYAALARLPIEGMPVVVSNGTYTVGQDIQPGTYKTTGAVDGFSSRTSRSRGLVFLRVLELTVAHDPVRYRDLILNPEPKKNPPAGDASWGHPPSLERPRARAPRPWRAADLDYAG